MRLVCPNCEAKYEVPEDAIPESGRDVQCANCGHAWYQMRPRSGGAETAAAPVVPPVPEVMPEPEPVIEPAVQVVEEVPVAAKEVVPEAVAAVEAAETVVEEPAPVSEASAEAMAEAEAPAAVADVAAAVEEAPVEVEAETAPEVGTEALLAAAAVPAAYAVDDSVLAILREEAEREAQARRAEGAKPLETQVDLGIEAAIPETRKPANIPAPAAALAAVETDDKPEDRRTRLPDVEEINSTLRPAEGSPDGDGMADAVPMPAEARSSFRSGFLLVLTVAILGSAIYGAADSLAEAVPALAGPLKAYVGFVDGLRLHLDGLMQSATVSINGG